jgi:hypothetical protein
MTRFLLLMHDDVSGDEDAHGWDPYLTSLRRSGHFEGGSSLGGGSAHRAGGEPAPLSQHLVGYLMVEAASLKAAQQFLDGNPVYMAGGTVEIRELLED